MGVKVMHMMSRICVCLAVAIGGAAGAQNAGETAIEGIDDRFAIASEHFGDGKVQIKSRTRVDDQDSYSVHEVDCAEGKMRTFFENTDEIAGFPAVSNTPGDAPFERMPGLGPLARHACEQHGFNLVEW